MSDVFVNTPPKYATEFMTQTPTLSLDEIALRLWQLNEFECYRALMAWSKERNALLSRIKEYERGD